MSADLEFTPFEESEPTDAAGGVVVDSAVPNPDYAEELAAHQAVLERNPFALNMVCETFRPTVMNRPEELVDADALCIDDPAVTLVVGYPFPRQHAVTVHSGSSKGFTRAELFRQLVRVYSAMYQGGASSSARFGIAWHRLEELAIEGVVTRTRGDGRTFAWIRIGA